MSDPSFTNESIGGRTLPDHERPPWTPPRVIKIEVARTLGGSGPSNDGLTHASSSLRG